MSTTVQSTPKKITSSRAASRKTHIPVVSHDRFAPVANDKYLNASNKKRDNTNTTIDAASHGRTSAFRHFSIGRSSATTTPVEKPSIHATVTPTTTTRTSKVPNFISRKPVKKEEVEIKPETATESDSPVAAAEDPNPEKSLSSPLLAQDSKIPTMSAFGSIRKNRGTDKFLSFFTGGRASHIPVVVKNEDRKIPFSLDSTQQQDAGSNIESVVNSEAQGDTNEMFHSTIDDSNEDTSENKNNNDEEEAAHSHSETSTIGNSTPSLHAVESSNLSNVSTPLSPTPLTVQQTNSALTSDSVGIETSNLNEEPQSPTVGSIITPSTAVVSEVILEEDETAVESPGGQESSFTASEIQEPNAGSSIRSASVVSDNGGSLSINSSIVSFKDTSRRTPLLFASQKGGNASSMMRQQQYYNQQNQQANADKGSSILSNERQQDNSSISSAGTSPQPEVSTSTRLNTAKIMGDGGRKAIAAVRRSIYRKHKSQPPPPRADGVNGQLSGNTSRDSSVRITSPREPIISFAKSRFEETGTQITQAPRDKTNNRNTWSNSTLISSTSELTENRDNTFRSNTIISRNQSSVTNGQQPPKKAGKKMMDWIKKKSQAKETKKETSNINEQTESSSRLTSSNQILTKSRGVSTRNDTPTATAATPALKKTNVTDDIKKITTASNKRVSHGATSILATSTNVNTDRAAVSILPSPAPSPTSPTPQPQQQKEKKTETLIIPSESNKSKRTVRALSGNGVSLLASSSKVGAVDEHIQYHQGAVDRTALTSQAPSQVINDVARILRILGIETRAEASNPYILRCCRRKAKAFMAAELLRNNEEKDDQIYTNESAITSTSEVSLLAPSSKDGQSLSSFPSSDPMSDSRGLEPIYGDASIDNGDEIRFAVEICRFKNLPGLYIVDIRRSKGNV